MQLFTHLLSSYLQGMGDFFSALPWGGSGRVFLWVGEGLYFFSFYLVKLNLMLNPKSLVVVGKLLFANSGVLVCRS